jgi:hypothetical protein
MWFALGLRSRWRKEIGETFLPEGWRSVQWGAKTFWVATLELGPRRLSGG